MAFTTGTAFSIPSGFTTGTDFSFEVIATLAGTSVSSSAGSAKAAVSVGISGTVVASARGSVGYNTADQQVAITGATVAGVAGAVQSSRSIPATGTPITPAVNPVASTHVVAPVGIGAATAAGTASVNSGANRSISGTTGTFAQGTVGILRSIGITGASGATAAGPVKGTLAAAVNTALLSTPTGTLKTATTATVTGVQNPVQRGTIVGQHLRFIAGQNVTSLDGGIPVTTRTLPLQGTPLPVDAGDVFKARLGRHITWVTAEYSASAVIVEDTRIH